MFGRDCLRACGLLFVLAIVARGQDETPRELYGNGVHAYYAGDYSAADDALSMAIEKGSKDPRAFYFRGLTRWRQGQQKKAQADFQTGADLEAADTDRFYDVSKSLERVQGRVRAMVERYRATGRRLAQKERERLRFERYERIRVSESDVLLKTDEIEAPPPEESPGGASAPAVAGEQPPSSDAAPTKDEVDPFAEDEPDDSTDEAADEAANDAPKVTPEKVGKALGGALFRVFQKKLSGDGAAPADAPQPGAAQPGAAQPEAASPEAAPPTVVPETPAPAAPPDAALPTDPAGADAPAAPPVKSDGT